MQLAVRTLSKTGLLVALVAALAAGCGEERGGPAPERAADAGRAQDDERPSQAARPTATVPAYGKWESRVPVGPQGLNPFDAEAVSVVAVFAHASGKQYRVPCFWFQGYACAVDKAQRTERMTPVGSPGFRVRFAPPLAGRFTYHFQVTAGSATKTAPGGVLLATAPEGKGPLTRRAKRRYLQNAAGEGVFLIGQNVAWSTDPAPLDDLLRYIDDMADSGQNVLRLWHCTWGLGYEHSETGRYDLERAWKLDRLLQAAEQRGLYVMLCLENSHDVKQEKSPYWRSLGAGAKGIAKPEEFFTSPAARSAFRSRIRYALARWGHSSAIGAWELFNEMEYVLLGPLELDSSVRDRYFRPWLDEMAAYTRTWDAHGHLLTNSLATDRLWDAMNRMPWLDIVQYHAYLNAWDTDAAAKVLRVLALVGDYEKPYLLGEFGGAEAGVYGATENTVNLADARGVHLHNALWASALSGACGTPLAWWWDTYVRPNRLYHHYAALHAFLRGTPWLDPHIRTADLSTADARVLALRGASWAIVWAQNRRYTWRNAREHNNLQPVGPLPLRLDHMQPGRYRIEWWDTSKGVVVRTQEMDCKGDVPVTIPELKADVALKFLRLGNDDEQPTQPDDATRGAVPPG